MASSCPATPGMDFPFTLHEAAPPAGAPAWAKDPFFARSAHADVVLFSGCEDDQCSADASCRYGRPAGAMTTAA